MIQILEIIIKISVLISSLLAIIFGFGVVWRVEKRLDTVFKLFLAAIIAFFIGEISNLFYVSKNSFWAYITPASKVFFVLLFLAGILEMRNMIRKIDREK